MTAQTDPFVRVYYSVMGDDEKFAQVFDNDARLACWLRLLLVADACYPAAAPMPQGVKRAALAHLVSVGLVDLMSGNRFRIHGLASERDRRSERAAASARKRWDDATALRPHSDRNASGTGRNADPMPIRTAPIQSEPNQSEPDARRDALEAIGAVEDLTGRPFGWAPGSPIVDTLTADVADLGLARVLSEYRSVKAAADGSPIDPAGIVFGAHKRLYPIPDAPPRKPVAVGKGQVQSIAEIREALDAR